MAVTTPAKVKKLLLAMDAFKGTYTIRVALLLAHLLFARIRERRTMMQAWANYLSNLKVQSA